MLVETEFPKLTYHFNPFGGLNTDELKQVFVPRSFSSAIIEDLKNDQIKIIEFVGAKGRGKTTHLRWLQRQCSSYPIFLLNAKSDFSTIIAASDAPILFVDSVHHLNIRQRVQLYHSKPKIVLTTHRRRFLEYKIADVPHKSYSFKGIGVDSLTAIIRNRIALSSNMPKEEIHFDQKIIHRLIQEYGDNYRGILNHLYDQFQNENP